MKGFNHLQKIVALLILIILSFNLIPISDYFFIRPTDEDKEVIEKEGKSSNTGSFSSETRLLRDYLEDRNAPYQWVDISQTGTPVMLSDDDFQQVNMGMTFDFYDGSFTSIFICSNGMVAFGNNTFDLWEYTNQQFPSNNYALFIALLWDDLNPDDGGNIYYQKLNNPTRFVVSWVNVPHYEFGGQNTFQVILYAGSGVISINYQQLNNQNSPTVGLNHGNGIHFNMPFFNQNPAAPSGLRFFITIPPIPDGVSFRDPNIYTTTCYAEYHPYVLAVNLTTYEGLDDISDLQINVDYNNTNITLGFNGTDNVFYKTNDPGGHIRLLDTSSYRNDGVDKWWLYFNVSFNFSFPHEDQVDCMVVSSGKCGITINTWFSSVLRVENDLEFQGSLDLTGEHQGTLGDGDWVRGGEKILVSGLKVAYEDTSNLYPHNEHFDVVVRDRGGNEWFRNESSGEEISLNITARNESDIHEEYEISIVNIPGEGECAWDLTFPVKVDADSPVSPPELVCHAGSYKSKETEYTNETKAFVTWEPVEDFGSGLKGYYISQVNNSGTTNGSFTTDTEMEVGGLEEGGVDIYVWCEDNVGNIGLPSGADIFVDRTVPVFRNLTPSDGSWHNDNEVAFSVEIWDEGGSGVDVSKVEYSVALEGGGSFAFWIPVWLENTGDVLVPSVNQPFTEGEENYVKWRAKDMAGNGFVESFPINIKVDTIPIEFGTELTGQEAWYNSKEIMSTITVSDHGSGVNISSLEARTSTSGNDDFGEWITIEAENVTEMSEGEFEVTVTFPYKEGTDNYLMFRGTDMVGNPSAFSEKFNFKVDTTKVYFGEFVPDNGTYSNEREVECFIEIFDDGIGVDPHSVQFSVSSKGAEEEHFDQWKKVPNVVPGNPAQVLMKIEFEWGNDSYIRFKADDLLGAGHVVSESYRIWINSRPEAVISSPSTDMELWSHIEVLFEAVNSSDEDGDNLTYYWTSNVTRNESLGSGSVLRAKLVQGKHLITVHVSDGHGYNVTGEVRITVLKKTEEKRDDGVLGGLGGKGSLFMWLLFGIGLLLIIIIIVVLLLVRRKKKKEEKERGAKEKELDGKDFSMGPTGGPPGPMQHPPPRGLGGTGPGVTQSGAFPPPFAGPPGPPPSQQPPPQLPPSPFPAYALPAFTTEMGPQDLSAMALPPAPPGAQTPAENIDMNDLMKDLSMLAEGPISPAPTPEPEEKPAEPSPEPPAPDAPLAPWGMETPADAPADTPASAPEPASPEKPPGPDEIPTPPQQEATDVALTCHSCSQDYVASITETPVVVVCPHCSTEGRIDSL